MKVIIAQLQHETNTFSPVPTPWESFGGHGGPALGQAAFDAVKDTRLPMAAFIHLAQAEGARIVTPFAAWANPSGPVDGAAYDRFCEILCDEIAKGCDAIFLDLHGAMVVADRTDDGEGTLLERLRPIRRPLSNLWATAIVAYAGTCVPAVAWSAAPPWGKKARTPT